MRHACPDRRASQLGGGARSLAELAGGGGDAPAGRRPTTARAAGGAAPAGVATRAEPSPLPWATAEDERAAAAGPLPAARAAKAAELAGSVDGLRLGSAGALPRRARGAGDPPPSSLGPVAVREAAERERAAEAAPPAPPPTQTPPPLPLPPQAGEPGAGGSDAEASAKPVRGAWRRPEWKS